MRLLLDTHAFLWYITNNERLSHDAAKAITDDSNDVYLSVVSVWETLVKYQLGRLKLPAPADEYLQRRQEQHGILSLPLEAADASRLLQLPSHHRDPFDRMLVCQAMHHDLTIVTSDEQVTRYAVRILNAR
jgi:PIN domain nuclease of toxin-antitoxin system